MRLGVLRPKMGALGALPEGAPAALPAPQPQADAPQPPPPAPPSAPPAAPPADAPHGVAGLTVRPVQQAPSRRVSAATEATPLFLGHLDRDASGSHDGPLVFDEGGEKEYGPSRWKATAEATVAKVFWDGFLWERMAYVAAKGYGAGATTLVRAPGGRAAPAERGARAGRARGRMQSRPGPGGSRGLQPRCAAH